MDGGRDGTIWDAYRYAIDVAALDWIGCCDHDNGHGRQYTWWMTQKLTDLFHVPGPFTPMFSYERSVAYPEGHRNVIKAQDSIGVWREKGFVSLALDKGYKLAFEASSDHILTHMG
jgi:hypothetical protein